MQFSSKVLAVTLVAAISYPVNVWVSLVRTAHMPIHLCGFGRELACGGQYALCQVSVCSPGGSGQGERGARWLPFQTAAGSVTALYKGGPASPDSHHSAARTGRNCTGRHLFVICGEFSNSWICKQPSGASRAGYAQGWRIYGASHLWSFYASIKNGMAKKISQ